MSQSILTLASIVALFMSLPASLVGQTIPPATPEEEGRLIAVLNSDDATHKETVDACRGLAAIGTKRAVPALAALLGDEKLSHMARYGLETIPDPSVDQALRDALAKLKGRPLVGVISSVGVRRDPQAVPLLVKKLGDSDSEVVQAAARALGKIGGPAAATALTQRLADAPDSIRPGVADACLACAETLLAQGKRDEAAAMYQRVGEADLPKQFQLAAKYGALRTRTGTGSP